MSDELREVRLVGFPLEVYRRAKEHTDELLREFSLIALGEQDHPDPTVPVRLLELINRLTRDFSGITDTTDEQRDNALEAGHASIDLTYRVPPAAAQASRELGPMLDEADEFCRRGNALLTLAAPREAKLFRDWYLQEFIAQLSGAEPMPWEDYLTAASDE